MSNLLKFWSSADHDIRYISNKPLKITTRDAIIITALTLIATIIVMWLYFVATSTPASSRIYGVAGIILTSMAAQYLYEYSGANNMIAESSLRYAKGSTLQKYVSRREAMIYQCLYKLLQLPKYKQQEENIKHNFDILKIILTEPDLCGKIMDAVATHTEQELRKKYPTKNNQIDLLLNLPHDVIPALNTISDHITENTAYDILVNGFTDYTLANTLIFSELKNDTESRGKQIAREVDSE